MTPKQRLNDALLDLCWRLWTIAGVRGAISESAPGIPVALEELMLLTAQLGDEDPRLRDEALDWCVSNHRFIAKPRLKTLLKRLPESARKAFGRWSITLQEKVGGNWPEPNGTGEHQSARSGKSTAPDLTHPELIHLKLRALFGVSARADVILALLAWPSPTFIASDLTYLGYTKRNLAAVLDWLASGGLLASASKGNQIRFSWKRRTELLDLVAPLPKLLPRWPLILEVVSVLLELVSNNEGRSERLAGVAAAKALSGLRNQLGTLGLEPPDEKPLSWPHVCTWIVDEVRALCEGTSSMLRQGTSLAFTHEKRRRANSA